MEYHTKIKRRIAELEASIKAAREELEELRVAERVIDRLSKTSTSKTPEQDDGLRPTSTTKSMTIAEMIVEAIETYGSMETNILFERLQQSRRPDLQQTTLSSTLSRAKAAGKIVYNDGKWDLPNSEPHDSQEKRSSMEDAPSIEEHGEDQLI